eukprot:6191133-Pleurochrysis_carterae.AAC.2
MRSKSEAQSIKAKAQSIKAKAQSIKAKAQSTKAKAQGIRAKARGHAPAARQWSRESAPLRKSSASCIACKRRRLRSPARSTADQSGSHA